MRVVFAGKNLGLTYWEDNLSSGQADYNDYLAAYELRDCVPARFSQDALAAHPACANNCGGCPSTWVGSDGSRFRVVGHLGVDTLKTERYPYEKNGRKILLSLALYSDFRVGELGGSQMAAAVCPTIHLKWRASPSLFKGTFGSVNFGDTTCGPASPPNSVGSCSKVTAAPANLPVALSLQQNRTSDPCLPYTAPSRSNDVFLIDENASCSAVPTIRSYEVRISDIDKVLGDPQLAYGSLDAPLFAASEIRFIDVLVFGNLPNGGKDFVCPSGTGTFFETIQPGNGDVVRFKLVPSGPQGGTLSFDGFHQ